MCGYETRGEASKGGEAGVSHTKELCPPKPLVSPPLHILSFRSISFILNTPSSKTKCRYKISLGPSINKWIHCVVLIIAATFRRWRLQQQIFPSTVLLPHFCHLNEYLTRYV